MTAPVLLPLYKGSQEPPTAQRCIAALVAARGNAKLAAERVGLLTDNGSGDEVALQLIISDDPNNIDILTQQIRTHTILSTFELLGKSLLLMSASLAELDAYDLSKHTNNLLKIMDDLTTVQKSDVNINVNDVLLKSLPTDMRELVKGFLDSDSNKS